MAKNKYPIISMSYCCNTHIYVMLKYIRVFNVKIFFKKIKMNDYGVLSEHLYVFNIYLAEIR